MEISPQELYQAMLKNPQNYSHEIWCEFPKEMILSKYMISTFGRIYGKHRKILLQPGIKPNWLC